MVTGDAQMAAFEDSCPAWQSADIAELVAVDLREPLHFTNRWSIIPQNKHIYGGQVVAQALAAVEACQPDGFASHAIHVLFLGAGDASRMVRFQVEPLRQGRSFATYRVRAFQGDLILLELLVSAHIDEGRGASHQHDMPKGLPGPEKLESIQLYSDRTGDPLGLIFCRRFMAHQSIEIRPCGPLGIVPGETAARLFWIRTRTERPVTEPRIQRSLLAYISDAWLASTSMVRHQDRIGANYPPMISLDHSLWIHHATDPGEWMLFETSSPFAGNQTGLSFGMLYDRSGRLIANVAQQSLIRV